MVQQKDEGASPQYSCATGTVSCREAVDPDPGLLPSAESPPATLYGRDQWPLGIHAVAPCGGSSLSLSSKPVFRCVVPCHQAVVLRAWFACPHIFTVSNEPHVFSDTQ